MGPKIIPDHPAVLITLSAVVIVVVTVSAKGYNILFYPQSALRAWYVMGVRPGPGIAA